MCYKVWRLSKFLKVKIFMRVNIFGGNIKSLAVLSNCSKFSTNNLNLDKKLLSSLCSLVARRLTT